MDNAELAPGDAPSVVDAHELVVVEAEGVQAALPVHGETERRRAWTVHGFGPAELIVLDERETTICEGGMAFAVAFPGGYSRLDAMLQQVSVASTTTLIHLRRRHLASTRAR